MKIWKLVKKYQDISLEKTEDGVGKITICRPEVRNAFRPQTVVELSRLSISAEMILPLEL